MEFPSPPLTLGEGSFRNAFTSHLVSRHFSPTPSAILGTQHSGLKGLWTRTGPLLGSCVAAKGEAAENVPSEGALGRQWWALGLPGAENMGLGQDLLPYSSCRLPWRLAMAVLRSGQGPWQPMPEWAMPFPVRILWAGKVPTAEKLQVS